MSRKKPAKMRKPGRPPKAFTPKTRLARRLCEVLGNYNIGEIAEIMDVSARSATRYMNGETDPSPSVLTRVAQHTERTPQWLLTGSDEGITSRSRGRSRIPIRACASAADALGVCHVAESLSPYDTKHIELPENLHAVRVHGDSMVPVALDGQHVLVSDKEAESGDLAVIECRDGRIIVKRISVTDHVVSAASLNPDPHYKPIILKRSEIRRMRKIVGVWMQKI